MTAITITKAMGRTEIKCRYDAEVIDIIKAVVPYQDRDYDGARKIWIVENLYVDDLIKALGRAGHFVGDTDIAPKPKGFFAPKDFADHAALQQAAEILQAIPPDRQGAVFRAMARILYPDLYGRKGTE